MSDILNNAIQTATDAARYRYLRDNYVQRWESVLPEKAGAKSLDLDFSAEGHDLDAAIDRARGMK